MFKMVLNHSNTSFEDQKYVGCTCCVKTFNWYLKYKSIAFRMIFWTLHIQIMSQSGVQN